MSLNIKDPEAHRLASAISRATGESMTSVVVGALRAYRARLEHQKGRAGIEELLLIASRIGAPAASYLDHAALLYDENGLPK